jgi:hypothetical protein
LARSLANRPTLIAVCDLVIGAALEVRSFARILDGPKAQVRAMLNSVVVTISIARPYAEVYRFCADPASFRRWNLLPEGVMEHLGGNDYLVDLPQGRRVMTFIPPNAFGVLDYQVRGQDEAVGRTRPLRLIPNEEGADLQMTWFQQPGVSDEQFQSEVEWLRADLLRLKTFIEAPANRIGSATEGPSS